MSNLDTWSGKRVARMAAALNILSGVFSGFSVFVLNKVYVRNDAAATAANILLFETRFRVGMVCELVGLAVFIISIALLYTIARAAGRRAALLFLVFSVVGGAIQSLDVLTDAGILLFLKGGPALAAIPTAQAQSIAFGLLRMHSTAYTVALAFMGVGSLSLAATLWHARFLPRVIGALMVLDGSGFLASSYSTLVSPAFAAKLVPFLPYGSALIAEGVLMFWLLIKGVDEQRWQEQNAASQLTRGA